MKIRFAAVAAAVLALMSLAPLAFAEESLTASLGLEAGACFDGPDVHATRSVSAEYRRAVESFDLGAYVRHAPAGLNCLQDGLTVDISASQRWGGTNYAVAEFAAQQIAQVGAYSLDGAGTTWHYEVDGTPSYAAALGAGTSWGDVSVRATVNAVPTEWVDGEEHGVRLTLAWAPELFGGDLLLQAVSDSGRRNSGLARWTRSFNDGPLAVTLAYRYEGGLDELASPFMASLAGGWSLAPGAPSTETFDAGLTWAVD